VSRRAPVALVLASLVSAAIACEQQPVAPVARNPSTELAMRELAGKVGELDAILRSVRPLEPFDQDRVTVLLGEIDALAAGLETLPPGTHPPLSNLARLRADVRRARESMAGEDPDYYFAGAVSGACVYCHSLPL
jgi:hypothetical protein